MYIGICSDSHDHVDHIQLAVKLFQKQRVDLVLHAGDYCSPFTIPLFRELPLHGVFGNNDGDHYLLMKKFQEAGVWLHGGFYAFDADGCSVALYHGTYPEITESLELSGKYDLVITGHTHTARIEKKGETVTLNPGTIHGFGSAGTVALLDTSTMEASIETL